MLNFTTVAINYKESDSYWHYCTSKDLRMGCCQFHNQIKKTLTRIWYLLWLSGLLGSEHLSCSSAISSLERNSLNFWTLWKEKNGKAKQIIPLLHATAVFITLGNCSPWSHFDVQPLDRQGFHFDWVRMYNNALKWSKIQNTFRNLNKNIKLTCY